MSITADKPHDLDLQCNWTWNLHHHHHLQLMCVVRVLLLLPSPWQPITYRLGRLLGSFSQNFTIDSNSRKIISTNFAGKISKRFIYQGNKVLLYRVFIFTEPPLKKLWSIIFLVTAITVFLNLVYIIGRALSSQPTPYQVLKKLKYGKLRLG